MIGVSSLIFVFYTQQKKCARDARTNNKRIPRDAWFLGESLGMRLSLSLLLAAVPLNQN